MTIQIGQRPYQVEGDGSSGRIGYVATCTEGETLADAIAAVEADAPTSIENGLSRQKLKYEEIGVNSDGDACQWYIDVPYGTINARLVPTTGTVLWEFTTAGGTQHITSSLALIFAYTDPSVSTLPAGWGGTIGATKDFIEGIDIVVPVYGKKATKYVSAGSINALKANLFALTGKTNDDVFVADGESFAAGEALLMGASGRKRTEVTPNDYEVTMEFMFNPNVTGLTIGGITGISKTGWQYLDITYEDREDSGFLFKMPIVASVHQVYKEGNFGALGL
jgi:hypothetical protein